MKKQVLSFGLALVAMLGTLLPQAALADGSVWGEVRNVPIEDDNVVGTLHLEKSWPVYKKDQLTLSPFVTGTAVFDEKGYDWNNKLALRAGGKLSYQVGLGGVITLRAGAAHEHYTKSGDSFSAPFGAAEYWFGWGFGSRAPGSSWGVIGNTSPAEKGNVIALVHAEQGFLAWNAGKGRITPFVDFTIGRDSKDLAWNNKEVYGLGVKYVQSVGDGSVSFGLKAEREERRLSGGTTGAVAFVNFWFPL